MRLRKSSWIVLVASICSLTALNGRAAHAELLGYWSANTTGGQGSILPNDQGNGDLDGELFEGAEYSSGGEGVTGQATDYAISFPGEDADYASIPATEVEFEEITIATWVKGVQTGAWAGLVVSRDGAQPIGLDIHDFDGQPTYIWNDNAASSWSFVTGLQIPEDVWTFVGLSISPDAATFYVGEKGGSLDSISNEIEHLPQLNLTEWRLSEDDCCGGTRNFSGLMDDVSIWDHALSDADMEKLFSGVATPLTLSGGAVVAGDYDGNGALEAADIDLLNVEVRSGGAGGKFDANADGSVTDADRDTWVRSLKKSWYGDANLDGVFNSSDLVAVFQIGEYEDGTDLNSTWAEGDWNGDGNFNSGDFVTAFSDGGFEVGPRAAVAAVPEPSSALLALIGGAALLRRRSR